jgi:hypothetical protein
MAFGIALLIFLAGLWVGIQRRSVLLVLSAGTAVGSGILLLLLHIALGLRYPLDRTGLYLLGLVALSLAGLADESEAPVWRKPISAISFGLSFLLAAQVLLEFNTRKFAVWDYDADTRVILKKIGESVPDKHPNSVRIANSWQLEPSLDFYALKDKLDWLQPISRAPITSGAG